MSKEIYPAGNWFVTGELGAGKTMFAVRMIQEYLLAGKRVATNLNLELTQMLPKSSRAVVHRIPDKPLRKHLDEMGDGYDLSQGYDESKFGLLVLDECLTWLNSRSWQDKERAPVLDWFLHARKHGWNIVFLLQSADYCDPQIRDNLLSYHVSCRKMGKYNIPVVGKFLGLKMPKGTLATIYAGYGSNAIQQGRDIYRGKELYTAYDTRQLFETGFEVVGNDLVDMRASYSVLSPWHLVGRYESKKAVVKLPFKWSRWIGYNVVRPLVLVGLFPFYPKQVLECF
jgi:hypothetical protein